MERVERKRIRIDGELTVDVDYEQLFPRLAYVRARAEQPDGDIYDVQGDQTGRDGWKRLMNAMLFANGSSQCASCSSGVSSTRAHPAPGVCCMAMLRAFFSLSAHTR